MNRYLLDTNILSELRKNTRAHPSVNHWFDNSNEETLLTSVLVFGEVRRGVERLRKKDSRQAEALEKWLESWKRFFGDRALPVDQRVADCWGGLAIDQKLPEIDGLLAATAIVHDLTLVTRNTNDFARSGVKLLDPFQ